MELQGSYFRCSTDSPEELLLVEGKHAANAVNRVRHKECQAVLALQGKVPNVVRQGLKRCLKSSAHVSLLARVLNSPVLSPGSTSLHKTFSTPHPETNAVDETGAKSPGKVIVISDPDADGLHASLLLIGLISELAPDIVADKRLFLCRSPLALMSQSGDATENAVPAYRESELKAGWSIQRFKGLASLPAEMLHRCCVDPQTRTSRTITAQDCNVIKQQLSIRSK